MQGQMWPIHGASKAKRISWWSPQNQISWAYMKQLRERNETLRVYDSNPYVEVYQFRDNMYGLFNQNCDGAGDVWMYLIIGPERAFLVDTGFGLGNMKALVDEITGGMPLIVANTHTGPDHVLGNVWFDRVYCLDIEEQNIRNRCKPGAYDYLFDEEGHNRWLDFDKKDLPAYRDYELIGVPNGYTWNLGEDYDIEIFWTGGHAAGHAVFIDKKGRNLFAGDCVCSDVIACGGGPMPGGAYNQYRNIQTYRDNLEKLCGRLDEFDYIFPGHFMVNLESILLLNILEALNQIVEDPESYTYKEIDTGGPMGPKAPGKEKMYMYVKGFGTISYNENGVYPPGSEQEKKA